jgi:hypothetical protein
MSKEDIADDANDKKKKNKNKRHGHLRSKRNRINEQKLDKAIEMTFPASDPVAITQPASDKDDSS